jgi:uncharacterized membrane protein
MTNNENSGFSLKPNIRSLSDLIFGLALSIGALTLLGQAVTDSSQVLFSLALYGFSFLILVGVWRVYSSIMSVLSETQGLTSVNVLLLFLVSVEPYLFNQLFASSSGFEISVLYSIDLAGIFLILAVFNHHLSNEERNLVPQNFLWKLRLARNVELVCAATVIISIIPAFWSITVIQVALGGTNYSIPLRVILWIVPLVLSWSRRWLEKLFEPKMK